MKRLGEDVFKHCQHIREEILTLKCPRCSAAFIDCKPNPLRLLCLSKSLKTSTLELLAEASCGCTVEGCMALTCGQCNAGFCGWCLADCGNDAHNHVARCSAKPPGADVYYATDAEYVSEPLMPMPKSRVLLRSLGLPIGCRRRHGAHGARR